MKTWRHRIGDAVLHALALSICCLLSYSLATRVLSRAMTLPHDEVLIGGMWAVMATLFVYRYRYETSLRAALSSMAVASVSFILCLIYLLVFPFRPWGMAALIGIGAVIMKLIGRPSEIVGTGTTTAVVMIVAGMSPHHAWRQPVFRVLDTALGAAVGVLSAWIGLMAAKSRPQRLDKVLKRLRFRHESGDERNNSPKAS